MPLENVFTIINAAIVPYWILLVVLPHHRLTQVLVHSGLIPVLYGFIYLYFLGTSFIMGSPEGGSMTSLEGLLIALSDPRALIGAWTHYLVFDLFVGAWITRDAKRVGIRYAVIIIPLVLTFVAGPFGLLLYVLIKGVWKKSFGLTET